MQCLPLTCSGVEAESGRKCKCKTLILNGKEVSLSNERFVFRVGYCRSISEESGDVSVQYV